MAEPRKRRANGEASRQRILDAAAEIAGERGYEGTSINLVSERSGLPASSIYWHFKDKDELITAVIDRSFTHWVDALERPVVAPDDATAEDMFRAGLQRTGHALAEFPDFLRLGLMLILVFSLHLGWLPTMGMVTLGSEGSGLSALMDVLIPLLIHASATPQAEEATIREDVRATLRSQETLWDLYTRHKGGGGRAHRGGLPDGCGLPGSCARASGSILAGGHGAQ